MAILDLSWHQDHWLCSGEHRSRRRSDRCYSGPAPQILVGGLRRIDLLAGVFQQCTRGEIMNAFRSEEKSSGQPNKPDGWVRRNRVQLIMGTAAVIAVVLIWYVI